MRLDGDKPESFVHRWHYDRGCRTVEIDELRLRERAVPSHAVGDIEAGRDRAQSVCVLAVPDDVETDSPLLGGQSAERVQQQLDSLLLVESPNEQQSIGVTLAPGRKKVGGDRHGRDRGLRRRDDLTCLGGEPPRYGGDDRGAMQHVSKRGSRECDRTRQSNVGTVKRRHERPIR
jgi:hypothetical protein